MTRAGAAPVGLARERAEDAPLRVSAARAEWKPLAALAEVRGEWREQEPVLRDVGAETRAACWALS